MTTIAASRTTMASDSKVSIEGQDIEYPAVKILKKRGVLIGAAGHGGDCTRFIKWAASQFNDKEPKWAEEEGEPDSVVGIIVKEDGIYLWSQGDPEPERVEAEFFAIGSGGYAAQAAMIMGADPVKAVEVACMVDPHSGGAGQVLHLKETK